MEGSGDLFQTITTFMFGLSGLKDAIVCIFTALALTLQGENERTYV